MKYIMLLKVFIIMNVNWIKKIYNPFSVDTPIIDIMKNEEGKKIIK